MKDQARQRFFLVVAACSLLAGAAAAQISSLPDAEIEQCLLEGEIGKKKGRLIGVTRPVRFEIDCSADVGSVVFKHYHDHRPGLTKLEGGLTERNFTDSYNYDRAAYLLDRQLGLNMVPVAVRRRIKASEGVLVAWIPNAAHESEMIDRRTGALMATLAPQKSMMRLFDALILNSDRRQENWLVDEDSGKLYLIDHTRAFRNSKQLPKEFTGQPARLTQAVYRNLEGLNEAQLTELMGDFIGKSQIRALLVRRDLILEKIDKDRQDLGEDFVFTDWQSSQPIAEVATADMGS